VSGRPSAAELLADDLARVLEGKPFGLSCDTLALRLRRRRGDVLAVLEADPRFEHYGHRRGSRWRIATEAPLLASRDGMGRILLPWPDIDPSGVPVVGRGAESA
jgi:hypothetical protein